MHYKSGVARNLREIGQQLGVANVVEGSVQRPLDSALMPVKRISPGRKISVRAIWTMKAL